MKNTILIIVAVGLAAGAVLLYSVFYTRERATTDVGNKSRLGTQTILGPKTNDDGGVTVAVTPKNISADAASWDFKISLDTHSVELLEDLTQVSILEDENGKKYEPTAWEGDPPGGHHREGILKFKPISPFPKALELKIEASGKVRSFKWPL
ncbi:MAG: hypothetical protein A2939_03535 [Parcubacteria group bacterium RIFCSPLOWO2_01_FULL_48_18]|nr:MAG: hypothetical protein A2939_03535 [Parcubacteria group bacterium RIFCSPLOWO2_01_FULL_48_18]OHB23122.1 MAG: hypothetical protein A3J67_03155 [Parcubacteria group bacterium RIFCSPHIGHO2_02_FULL_48_10b]